jgi:trk system potassium uptake protein TrkH
MFIGACAGSTGGGIKVSRLVIVFKTVIKELNSYIHPKSIKKIKIEGKPVEHEVVRAINVYFITFMIIFSISVFAISFEGKDLVTNFTAVAATINNIGPGLEMVGPTENFSIFTPFSKYVLMFDMLAGRLELFPLLILFHPAVWKELFTTKFYPKKK